MIKIIIALFGSLFMLSCYAGQYHYKVDNDVLHIYLNKPDTVKVYFFTSLDHFEQHEVFKNNKGVWELTVPSDREFRYFFSADGIIFLPDCEKKEIDDFGSENCVYIPER